MFRGFTQMSRHCNARRRWLQFSLRSILLAILILSVLLAWVAHRAAQKREERRAIESLKQLGVCVEYDWQKDAGKCAPPGPKWLHALLGEDFFATVKGARAITTRMDVLLSARRRRGINVDDEGVARAHGAALLASELEFLQELDLGYANVGDESMEAIAQLTHLRALSLHGTRVTDDGLANLTRTTDLKVLSLARTAVGDGGIRQLRGMTKLERLILCATQISDEGVADLASLMNLRDLDLGGCAITDKGVAQLAKITSLESIGLANTQTTDAGLYILRSLPRLSQLDLGHTLITDAGVKHIMEMRNLTILWLPGESVSESATRKLQAALPLCAVYR